MIPQYEPTSNPERSPAFPAGLAAELHRAHVLLMKTGAVANLLLEQSNVLTGGPRSETALAKVMVAHGMASLSARLGEQLHSVRRVCGRLAARGVDPASVMLPAVTSPTAPIARPARQPLLAAPGIARGRLKNGNPVGDYLAAPRCGAKTRAHACCRQPAMANGRCRFHGGKSTGARTPEGLRRCRIARFRHGGRGRPVLALRSRACHAARRLRLLSDALSVAGQHRQPSIRASHPMSGENRAARLPRMAERNPAGHGVDRSVFDCRPAPTGPALQNPSTPPLRAA